MSVCSYHCSSILSGTGKSETGAHIAYALAMSNRDRGFNECVIYSAPTNKAVDVVLSKLHPSSIAYAPKVLGIKKLTVLFFHV